MKQKNGQPNSKASDEDQPKSTRIRGRSTNTKQREYSKDQIQPRTPIKGKVEAVEISSSSDIEVMERSSPEGISRKRKSILQPKGSKYSKKATGCRQSFRVNGDDGVDDQDNDLNAEDTSPLAALAPRNTIKESLSNAHSSALDNYSSHHDYLPRKYTELKLVEYKMPSTEPQGPGDLWTCTFEGCHYRVHAASTSDGRARIKMHFVEHADSAKAKIDLALQESRPYLPVE